MSEAQAKTAAEERKEILIQNGMTKYDPPMLRELSASALTSNSGTAFLPANMAEAMELAKMMSASNFVPAHLRGKPGDCLAVVMQSSRWGMDPYAVGNKTYFVNDRIAYEAQLVNAVINTRAPLDGRLNVTWDGDGATLICKVVGKIKGDGEGVTHTVWQELKDITTKNSPLWKQSPRQQLAYYATRLWARLYCPEVLLGVYTDDEMRDGGTLQQQGDGTYRAPPPRPTRELANAAQRAAEDLDNQNRTHSEPPPKKTEQQKEDPRPVPEHDDDGVGKAEDTGAQSEETKPAAEPEPMEPTFKLLASKFADARSMKALDAILVDYKDEIKQLSTEAPKRHKTLLEHIDKRREAIKAKG